MKIEKLTENKIRIILKEEDLRKKSIDTNAHTLSTPEYQKLFLEILVKAKKELDFNTDGHKLLIEAYSENKDAFIFIITKYIEPTNNNKSKPKKYLASKPKQLTNLYQIFKFDDFEDYCSACNSIAENNNIVLKGIFKTSVLYNYNNYYYLIIDGLNNKHKSAKVLLATLSEFSNQLSYTKNFSFKLKEHGKLIIKNNAINTGIRYFSGTNRNTKNRITSLFHKKTLKVIHNLS